jgi:hypothetical protein
MKVEYILFIKMHLINHQRLNLLADFQGLMQND